MSATTNVKKEGSDPVIIEPQGDPSVTFSGEDLIDLPLVVSAASTIYAGRRIDPDMAVLQAMRIIRASVIKLQRLRGDKTSKDGGEG